MGKAVLILLITSVSFALTSLHLVNQLRSERAQVASLQERIVELEKTSQAPVALPVQSLDATPSEPLPTEATMESAPEPQKPAAFATAPSPSRILPATELSSNDERMRMFKEHMERQRTLMKDPEYREAMLMQQKLSYTRMHPDLAAELGLTDEQAERFATLLAEHQLQSMEAGLAFRVEAESPAQAEERHRLFAEQEKARQAQIEQFLGPEKYQAWKEYQETLGARHQVNELRSLFAAKGVPLQDELAKPLIKAMADEQRRQMEEMAQAIRANGRLQGVFTAGHLAPMAVGMDENSVERMAQSQRRLRESLSAHLTPEQLEVLEAEQKTQLELHRASVRVMRKQAETQGPAGLSSYGASAYAVFQAPQSQ